MKLSRITLLSVIISGLLFAVGVSTGTAKMFFDAEIVSGKITAVEENAVTLKGEQYHAASAAEDFTQGVGDTVTLRFYTMDDKNIFIEIKNGAGSLKQQSPPAPAKKSEK